MVVNIKSLKGKLFVPDTSVIIEGIISKLVEEKKIKGKIIIHNAVLAELEHQANNKRTTGILGINEIKKLREEKVLEIEFDGEFPNYNQIKYAKQGSIDSMIRSLAQLKGATLLTGDHVQHDIALAMGLDSELVEFEKEDIKELSIKKFFDETTMSVHLREGTTPKAKKGKPGEWEFVELSTKKLTSHDVEDYAEEIIEKTKLDNESFIEIENVGSTIVQFRNYRIVITQPPLSDGWEITAVKPVKILTLEDYNLPEKLLNRLKEKAEGILVAGAPGNGKSTFCQAIGSFYLTQDKIIKTIEAPRDLILPPEVTQYSKTMASSSELHDILLLSRPDYTIFDEIRNTEDFELFKDLRLSGVGMIGVVHATKAIDAIQRFIGRVELGMVPSIIDTVLFIEKGQVGQVLDINMTVRVPSGMTEADLARPLIEVKDFISGELVYEMYTFGEQTVVVPVTKIKKTTSFARSVAGDALKERIRRELPKGMNMSLSMPTEDSLEILVPKSKIPQIIGRKGQNIEKIEKKLGVKIQVRELDPSMEGLIDKEEGTAENDKQSIEYEMEIGKRSVSLMLGDNHRGQSVDIEIDGEYLTTVTASKIGEIKFSNKNETGQRIIQAHNAGERIEVIL